MPDKDWAKKNPERRRELNRLSAERNREKRRKLSRDHAAANREVYSARVRTWREANPDRDKVNNQRNSAKRRTRMVGDIEGYDAVLYRDPCCYCGADCEAIDHIIPLVRGGSHTWDNLTAACNNCNGRKHAKPMLIFLLEKGP